MYCPHYTTGYAGYSAYDYYGAAAAATDLAIGGVPNSVDATGASVQVSYQRRFLCAQSTSDLI